MNKYVLSLFMVLVLIGAGCTTQTTVEGNADSSSNDSQGDEAAPDETDASAQVEAQIEFETQDGTTVTQNLDSTTSAQTENEIPVTEIILGEASDVEVNMESGNFFFSPNTITASPGATVTVTFTGNAGFHTFVIDEIDAKFAINAGEAFIFTAPSEPGEYAFYCDIGSHRSMGMEGTLIVK